MRSLAGEMGCDVVIRGALDEAGIPRVKLPEPMKREVAASIVGQLGPYRFTRAWYYWVVEGEVPLAVAEEMYATELGKRDVRIGGHCGCPAPGEFGTRHYDANGVHLIHDPTGKRERVDLAFLDAHPEYKEGWNSRHVRDAATEAVRSVVDGYHIDSQEGLNLFAETIRRHGLDKEERS